MRAVTGLPGEDVASNLAIVTFINGRLSILSTVNTMQETAVKSRPIEMGCLESKNVITTDGRMIGVLTGAYMDTSNWSVTSLVVELEKDVVSELNVKKPLLRTAKVTVPTSTVLNIADVVQLNTDMANLSTIVAQPS